MGHREQFQGVGMRDRILACVDTTGIPSRKDGLEGSGASGKDGRADVALVFQGTPLRMQKTTPRLSHLRCLEPHGRIL